jgi:hypothetical protein
LKTGSFILQYATIEKEVAETDFPLDVTIFKDNQDNADEKLTYFDSKKKIHIGPYYYRY